MKTSQLLAESIKRQDRGKKKKFRITNSMGKDYDPKNPQDYFYMYEFIYEYNTGTFTSEDIHAYDNDKYHIEDEIADLENDLPTEEHDHKWIKKQKKDILWAGWGLGEAEFVNEEDEEGQYEHIDGHGLAYIVSSRRLSDGALKKIINKIEQDMDRTARQFIENARENANDQEQYDNDPYAYYGLSKSDFY